MSSTPLLEPRELLARSLSRLSRTISGGNPGEGQDDRERGGLASLVPGLQRLVSEQVVTYSGRPPEHRRTSGLVRLSRQVVDKSPFPKGAREWNGPPTHDTPRHLLAQGPRPSRCGSGHRVGACRQIGRGSRLTWNLLPVRRSHRGWWSQARLRRRSRSPRAPVTRARTEPMPAGSISGIGVGGSGTAAS